MVAPACTHLRTTPAPLRTQNWPARAEARASTLLVLLPGRGGLWGDFERHGFISKLREEGINADVITVDAHLGYYYRRTIIDRLQADVFGPARAQGYRRIVVAGISLGGLGALLSARDQAGSVDGLILLSPYLGADAALFKEIDAAGGPVRWAAGRTPLDGKVDQEVWTFLGQRASDLPPVWLLFGAEDRLRVGQRLLARLLPAARVRVAPGAHDWRTWEKLWAEVCETSEVFASEKQSAL